MDAAQEAASITREVPASFGSEQWVHDNAFKKGQPNMTAASFYVYVNSILLPSHRLPTYFPRTISFRTVVRWLHRV